MSCDREMGFDVPARSESEATQYLLDRGILRLLQRVGSPGQKAPDVRDLARIHHLVVSRRAFTVLEFGIGWSTIVIAAALRENEQHWERVHPRPKIRAADPFTVFSADASEKWIENLRAMLPGELEKYVNVTHSRVVAGTFSSRVCHYFERLPDVVPDFIYVDGPNSSAVEGTVYGASWKNPDRTILAGDLCLLEPVFLPGTCILFDGRTNNARFLGNNFQRIWGFCEDRENDFSLLELQEPPLGPINERTLRYCLGEAFFERVARRRG